MAFDRSSIKDYLLITYDLLYDKFNHTPSCNNKSADIERPEVESKVKTDLYSATKPKQRNRGTTS